MNERICIKEIGKKIFMALLLVMVFVFATSVQSHAYTEEEKQQAKAWLSAHGYSPDAGGAAAAYQDYLNGKFDEELGITREETSEATETTEQSTEKAAEDEEKTEGAADSTSAKSGDTAAGSVWDIMAGGEASQGTSEAADASTEDGSTEEAEQEATTETMVEPEDSTEPEPLDETGSIEESGTAVTGENQQGEVTMYLPEKAEQYKEAVIVVLLSVMLVALFWGAAALFRGSRM